MDITQQFSTDEKLENEGVWSPIGGGAKVLVARSGNRDYLRRLSELVEVNQRALEAKTPAAEELNKQITRQLTAETVLLDWSGFTRDGGLPDAYSRARADELLAIKDFMALIQRLAGDFDKYRTFREAEVVKN